MSAYVMSTFQENINKFDELNSLLENTLLNYEFYTLAEGAIPNAANEKKGLLTKAGQTLKKLWDQVVQLFRKIGAVLDAMVKKTIGSNVYYIAKEDIEVSPYIGTKFPESVCSKIVSLSEDSNDDQIDKLSDDIDEITTKNENQRITIPKGKKIDIKMYIDHKKKNDKYIDAIDNRIKNLFIIRDDGNDDKRTKESSVLRKLILFLHNLGKDISAVISNCKLFGKSIDVKAYDKDGKRISVTNSRIVNKYDKHYRNYDDVHGIAANESVTKNEFIAGIMLEAAELLKNDTYYSDDYTTNIDNILTEAIALDGDYTALTEAISEIKDIEKIKTEIKDKDIDEKKSKNIIQKVKNALNNLLKWYYKIEPDKKFKALHTVLSGLETVLTFLSALISMSLAPLGVGMSSSGMVGNILGPRDPAAHVFYKKLFLASAIAEILSIVILKLSSKFTESQNLKYNVVDYKANRKSITDQMDKIDKQIDKLDDVKTKGKLLKLKKSYVVLLNKLDAINESYTDSNENNK